MKHAQWLISVIGFCAMTHVYAAEIFSFLDSKEESRESFGAINNSTDFWGTDQSASANDGSQLVGFHINTNGSVSRTAYPNSYIADLKPKNSEISHGLDKASGYVEQVWPLPSGDVLFTSEILPKRSSYLYKFNSKTGTVGNNPPNYDNKQALMNMGERGGVPQANIRSLHHRSVLFAKLPHNKTALFYGEYNVSDKNWVALWKSTTMGDTWDKVIEWNTVGQQTRNIRGIVQNPYNGWIYILLGDTDSESAIIAWDGVSVAPPDNTALDKIADYKGWKITAGSQRVRTGDLVFTPPPNGKCVWIPDVDTLKPGEKLYGQRANYDLTELEATGEVPYVDHIPPILGARSNTGNIYWASFRDSLATEKKLHLWKSTDSGLHWGLAAKVDIYTDWTVVPQNLRVYGLVTQDQIIDTLSLNGRDLEFVTTGKKIGSTANFLSKTTGLHNPTVTMPDTAATRLGLSRIIEVAKNDNNAADSKAVIMGAPTHGSVLPSCCGSIEYTPNRGFAGTDSFRYALQNAAGLSNTSTVDVAVLYSKNDTYTGVANSANSQTFSVAALNSIGKNDFPVDFIERTFAVSSRIKRIGGTGKAYIALKLNTTTGAFSYTLTTPVLALTNAQKQAAKRGVYQFTYNTTANGVATLPATVTITIK
jgi:Bacterial Ig domain